jgi:hypothetical protein
MKPYSNKHIIISTPDNQSHDIFLKDNLGELTFHSRYDNYEDAMEEKGSLDTRLSQTDIIDMIKNLKIELN